jgi:hypothetical protein
MPIAKGPFTAFPVWSASQLRMRNWLTAGQRKEAANEPESITGSLTPNVIGGDDVVGEVVSHDSGKSHTRSFRQGQGG